MGDVHNGARWRELTEEYCPRGAWCEVEECWCPTGREILFDLRPRHPWGPSLDHIIEVQYGGAEYDPANLRPAHLSCNVRKSNKLRAAARAEAAAAARRRPGRARTAALGAGRAGRAASALDGA